jgi:CRP/FNR family cyclic AMP-dependent transcriptional regulator
MNRSTLLNTLESIRFLNGVCAADREQIADIARLEEYEEGDVVFAAGDSVDNVYLVVNGAITLEVNGSGVSPQRLLTVGPGESLGWSALIRRKERVSTAKATAPTLVFRIDGQRLLELSEQNVRLGYQIMRATAVALADRLHAMRMRYLEVYRLQPNTFICESAEVGVD